MPLPLLIPLVALAGKAVLTMKAAAAAKAGIVVLAKAGATKAVATKALVGAAHVYGWGNVIAFSAVATISIGAAALLIKRAETLKRAIAAKDVGGSLRAATSLLNELGGHGGLDASSKLLHDFISAGGDHLPLAERVSAMLDDLIGVLRRRIA